MTLIDPEAFDAELRERLRAAVEQTVRARQARRDAQAEFRRRRAYGLTQRHENKLRRRP